MNFVNDLEKNITKFIKCLRKKVPKFLSWVPIMKSRNSKSDRGKNCEIWERSQKKYLILANKCGNKLRISSTGRGKKSVKLFWEKYCEIRQWYLGKTKNNQMVSVKKKQNAWNDLGGRVKIRQMIENNIVKFEERSRKKSVNFVKWSKK